MLTQETIETGWVLRCTAADAGAPAEVVSREIPATVPGCVHTDLLAADLITDPYLDSTEPTLTWIGESDWSYTTTLPTLPQTQTPNPPTPNPQTPPVIMHDSVPVVPGPPPNPAVIMHDSVPPYDRIDLVFDGLDTVAEVLLDGASVLSSRNMHRGYRVDITERFTGAPQELQVRFASPERFARGEAERLGPLPRPYEAPFNVIRKMACNFGWDWGPSLVTSGIWKPARLEAWSTARLARVRPHVTVSSDGVGQVLLDVELERAGIDRPVLVVAEVAGVREELRIDAGLVGAQLELAVPDPQLWWPRGHGAQPLHDLVVTLQMADTGEALDSWTRRIGFRTVALDVTPDETAPGVAGTPFTFRINGRPISVQGANWIPDDCFPTRISPERYRRRIEQAVAANVNLLRVWGGGIYESDDFYDVCDELGVLTWQDFLFACAAYSEDDETAAEVVAEAHENVTRLMPHASLVLWNGNNENIWGHADWGWVEQLDGRPWGLGYYTGLLPTVVAETDPTTPYWPGSPWSGTPDLHPNDPAHGNMHIWDVWNQVDYTVYRDYRPRFVSEFGYQGPPTWSTLTRAVHDEPLRPDSPGMLAHQKAVDGDLKLRRGLEAHFGVPDTDSPAGMNDWHLLTQLDQARAVQFGVEHFRSLWPLCTGAIVWQLNDCWPVTSWAAIDGDGRRKPLWYALRAAYSPRLITVQPRPEGLAVIAINDTDEPWSARLTARRADLAGESLAVEELRIEVPARAVGEHVLGPAGTPQDERGELLVVDGGPRRAVWTWAEDKDLTLPKADLEATAEKIDGTVLVTVTARSLLRDVCLFPDRLSAAAEVDDLLVTLLPGESHRFTVTGLEVDQVSALTTAPVLRCVNDVAVVLGRPAEVIG